MLHRDARRKGVRVVVLARADGISSLRVLVTGATGFVGSHIAAAIHRHGHRLRALVRRADAAPGALEPLGLAADDVELVTGDVTDPASVAGALDGVDAVVHAANVYSLQPAATSGMWRVNVDGTRLVLHAAAERQVERIVYVSSMTALLPADMITPATSIGTPPTPYARSKAASERIAEQLQRDGAPLDVTSLSSVFGPHDPKMGENAAGLRTLLGPGVRPEAPGGFGMVDVRDVAVAHVRLLEHTPRPGRYLMGGHWVSLRRFYALLRQVTGRRLPSVRTTPSGLLRLGRLSDLAARLGVDLGFSYETAWLVDSFGTFDDDDTRSELGLAWRPPDRTLRDTIAWLHAEGEITSRQAGDAAMYALSGSLVGAR